VRALLETCPYRDYDLVGVPNRGKRAGLLNGVDFPAILLSASCMLRSVSISTAEVCVEYEYGSMFGKGPGKEYALLLTAGEPRARSPIMVS
jgi:hypothetical protein